MQISNFLNHLVPYSSGATDRLGSLSLGTALKPQNGELNEKGRGSCNYPVHVKGVCEMAC